MKRSAGSSNHVKRAFFPILFILAMISTVGFSDVETFITSKKVKSGDIAVYDDFGCAVAVSGAAAIVGDRTDDQAADSAGAVYILEKNGSEWEQAHKFLPSDAGYMDSFGISVDIDKNTAVAGMIGYWAGSSDRNAAYVYQKSGGSWNRAVEIPSPDSEIHDGFGYAVAVYGETIVVGAQHKDTAAPDAGAVFIYQDTSDKNDWTTYSKTVLVASDANDNDSFGDAVDIQGDTIVVGNSHDCDTWNDGGSIYVFKDTSAGGDWSSYTETKIVATGLADYRYFGRAVAVEGKTVVGSSTQKVYIYQDTSAGCDWSSYSETVINHPAGSLSLSGRSLLAGNHLDSDGGSEAGIAYLVRDTSPSGDWSVTGEIKLAAPSPDANDWFGYSVSLDGDTPVVGTPGDDETKTSSGAVYFFSILKYLEDKITASDADQDDRFGRAIDLDGDTAIIGAWKEAEGGTDAGAAYIFQKIGTSWVEKKKIVASDAAEDDNNAWSVGISGDTAIIGSDLNDEAGSDAGAAYIYRDTSPGGDWSTVSETKIMAADTVADDSFGWAVDICNDTVVIGAPFKSDKGYKSGAAYVFRRVGSSWVEKTKLDPPDIDNYDLFGHEVSANDNAVLIGSYMNNGSCDYSGSAYIFRDTSLAGDWSSTATVKITASDGAESDSFGYSVSLDGDNAVVGARLTDETAQNTGAAYLFHDTSPGGDWSSFTEKKINASDASADDWFGYSVDIQGNRIITGAPQKDLSGYDDGAAYVYTGTDWGTEYILNAFDGDESDEYGRECAIFDNIAMVGAHRDEYNSFINAGSVYVYQLGPSVLTIERWNPDSMKTKEASVQFRVLFDQHVNHIDTGAFSLNTTSGQNGATITGVSSPGGTSVTVTVATVPSKDGLVRLDLKDPSAITNDDGTTLTLGRAGDEYYHVDTLGPVVDSIVPRNPGPTNADSVIFDVRFDEDVSGLASGAFSVSTISGDAAGSVNSTIGGGGGNYTVTVENITGDGEFRLDLDNTSGITDGVGNALSSGACGDPVSIDNTPPQSWLDAVTDNTQASTVTLNFHATDNGGSGIDFTRLYVWPPAVSGFEDSGLKEYGETGTFHYTSTGENGWYAFATGAHDIAGNMEAAPTTSTIFILFNTNRNGPFTQTLVTGDETTTFPMTTDIDILITIANALAGGQITIQRVTPLGTPPPGYNPNRLIDEYLIITGNSLGSGWTATITWNYDPESAVGLEGVFDSVFRFVGGVLQRTFHITPSNNRLIIPGVTAFSNWYAGNNASEVYGWKILK